MTLLAHNEIEDVSTWRSCKLYLMFSGAIHLVAFSVA